MDTNNEVGAEQEVNSIDWFGFFGKKLTVLVQYLGPNDIFLIGAIGLLHSCDEIETELQNEDSKELFEKGCGEYVFDCGYNEEQRGAFGMIELPSWWDLDEVAFKPYDMGEEEPNATNQPRLD